MQYNRESEKEVEPDVIKTKKQIEELKLNTISKKRGLAPFYINLF